MKVLALVVCVALLGCDRADRGHGHGHSHAHGHAHEHEPGGECRCASAKLQHGWCAACQTGWVAGLQVESQMLFDGLDPHGHDLDRDVMQCETCKRMMQDGGFCEACRFGWIDGQAYMSRLTYHLGLGETRDVDALSCATCRGLAGGVEWCDACAGGWAGNVYFEDRDDHADAAREIARLEAAIEASARCETCALVLLVDKSCPYCKISYEGGRPVGESTDEGGG